MTSLCNHTKISKHKRHNKINNILKKIRFPKPKSYIEKILFCPIELQCKDLINSSIINEELSNTIDKSVVKSRTINQEIVLYGDILIFKCNPLYEPKITPRYDIFNFTKNVTNSSFVNKHLHNVTFFYSPMIKMSFYEILFDYLQYRCLLYSISVHFPSKIFICLTKDKLYIYTYIEAQSCTINISNIMYTWLDTLHILQIKDPQKCTSLQKCTLHITNVDSRICITFKTVTPVYLESDLEILEQQFQQSTLPLLAHRCSVLSGVSENNCF
jgi:hypothetical protein